MSWEGEMKKVTLAAVIVGIFVLTAMMGASDWPDLAPEPQLLEPRGEIVDLTGKDSLEFKWTFVGRMWQRQYYDFRLYKGRQRMEGTQIIVKQVPKNQYSISIDAGVFEDGQVYSWGVKQVYMDRKSEEAYSSFEVKKSAAKAAITDKTP
jgi:hypothetical protein